MQLLSFLGRAPKTEADGYRTTTYEFADGSKTKPVSFFGWPLIERLQPERVIILGTSGSMWDHLLESIRSDIAEELHLQLLDQVDNKQVEQSLLDELEAAFQAKLGIPCELAIIPYGRDMDEQIQIMETIADYIPEQADVALDVTHGFRHLPMLGLLSAQYLQHIKHATIKHIYYGMFDPDSQKGEVYDLHGLLQLNDWVFALAQFDKDGDYGVFSKPLQQDGFRQAGIQALEKAAYFERVFNVAQARQQLTAFKSRLDGNLPGAGKLFTHALNERVEWAESATLYQHQRQLAHFYLDNGDFVRASVFAVEAFISSLLRSDEAEYDYETRNNAEADFRATRNNRGKPIHREPYETLKRIRNSLAHGTRPKDRHIDKIMQDDVKLARHLNKLFKQLGL